MKTISENNKKTFGNYKAIVLAADRGPDDPVAIAANAPCKSFVPVDGTPMILRVLTALEEAKEIDSRMICGPSQSLLHKQPELSGLIKSGSIEWIQHHATPSSSVYNALNSIAHDTPVLITTADHAILNAGTIDYFCSEARATNCDIVVGLVSHDLVLEAYPDTRRTVIRMREGGYCTCNLFAFLTRRGHSAANFWRSYENNRKKTLKVISSVGWSAVLLYLLGRLTLDDALRKISQRIQLKVGAVILPFPDAAIDVDSVNDLRLVESIISGRKA